jgi:hypothetical protein
LIVRIGRPLLEPGPQRRHLLYDILEAIENEEIGVLDNGKRKPMKKAEIYFRLLFTRAINGDLKTARLLVQMAEEYFAPEASAYWENEFIGVTEAKQRFGSNWPKKSTS